MIILNRFAMHLLQTFADDAYKRANRPLIDAEALRPKPVELNATRSNGSIGFGGIGNGAGGVSELLTMTPTASMEAQHHNNAVDEDHDDDNDNVGDDDDDDIAGGDDDDVDVDDDASDATNLGKRPLLAFKPRFPLVHRITTNEIIGNNDHWVRSSTGFEHVRFGVPHVIASALCLLPRNLQPMIARLRAVCRAVGQNVCSAMNDTSFRVQPDAGATPLPTLDDYVATLDSGESFRVLLSSCRVMRYLQTMGFTYESQPEHATCACSVFASPSSPATMLAVVVQVLMAQLFVRLLPFLAQRQLRRITPHTILLVVQRDSALRRLFGNVDSDVARLNKHREEAQLRVRVANWRELPNMVAVSEILRATEQVSLTSVRVPLFGALSQLARTQVVSSASNNIDTNTGTTNTGKRKAASSVPVPRRRTLTHLLAAADGVCDPGELADEFDTYSRVRLDPYRYAGRVLPFSVVSMIMSLVHPIDLLPMMLVCKQWFTLANEDSLWHTIDCRGVEHCITPELLDVLLRRAGSRLRRLSLAHCYRLDSDSLMVVQRCSGLEELDLTCVASMGEHARRPTVPNSVYVRSARVDFHVHDLMTEAEARDGELLAPLLECVPWRLPQLRSLVLDDCAVAGPPPWLVGMPVSPDYLVAQGMERTADTDALLREGNAAMFAACWRLERLGFANSALERHLAPMLRCCSNLQQLQLANVIGMISITRSLQACSSLRHLDMASCTFVGAQLSQVFECTTMLESLALVRCRVDAVVLGVLATQAPQLARLDVSFSNDVSGDAIGALVAALPNLTHLTMRSCRGVQKLIAQSASLVHLDASENSDLQHAEVSAPELRWFSVRNAHKLQRLHVFADKLHTLVLSFTRVVGGSDGGDSARRPVDMPPPPSLGATPFPATAAMGTPIEALTFGAILGGGGGVGVVGGVGGGEQDPFVVNTPVLSATTAAAMAATTSTLDGLGSSDGEDGEVRELFLSCGNVRELEILAFSERWLGLIAETMPRVEFLDVSFSRALHGESLTTLLSALPQLRYIAIDGCKFVTAAALSAICATTAGARVQFGVTRATMRSLQRADMQ